MPIELSDRKRDLWGRVQSMILNETNGDATLASFWLFERASWWAVHRNADSKHCVDVLFEQYRRKGEDL